MLMHMKMNKKKFLIDNKHRDKYRILNIIEDIFTGDKSNISYSNIDKYTTYMPAIKYEQIPLKLSNVDCKSTKRSENIINRNLE